MQVVEHGRFTATSRAVGIPISTISKRIASLEAAAGTGLLRRTSRSMSVTEAGNLLLPHARSINEIGRQAEHMLFERSFDLTGTIRVAASVALARFALAPLLPRFLASYPRARISVDVANQFVDLIGGGFDIGLRAHSGPLKDSTLMQRVVVQTPWSLAASPRWLERQGEPTGPGQLEMAEVLYFATEAQEPRWSARYMDEQVDVRLFPRLCSNDMAMLLEVAIEEGGIVALPNYILGPSISTGRLRAVLPKWSIMTSYISVLTLPKRQNSQLGQLFADFLAQELRTVTERLSSISG